MRAAISCILFVCLLVACGATEHRHATLESVPIDPPPAPPVAPPPPPPPPPEPPLLTREGGVEHCHCWAQETGGVKRECFGAVCRCFANGKPLCPDGYIPGSVLPCGEPGALHHTGEACSGNTTDGASLDGTFVCDPCGPWASPDELSPKLLCVGSTSRSTRVIDIPWGEWRCPSGKVVAAGRNEAHEDVQRMWKKR